MNTLGANNFLAQLEKGNVVVKWIFVNKFWMWKDGAYLDPNLSYVLFYKVIISCCYRDTVRALLRSKAMCCSKNPSEYKCFWVKYVAVLFLGNKENPN